MAEVTNTASITSKCAARMLTPLRSVKARGCRIKLEDDRWYLDWECGMFGPLYGYAPSWWRAAMFKAINAGPSNTIAHRNERIVAEMLGDFLPDVEAVRFMLNGSDACAAASKLSRAVTGREKLMVYGYHGTATAYCSPPDAPARPGLQSEDNRWGVLDAEKAAFVPLDWLGGWDHTHRVAAVIVECPPNDGGKEESTAWLRRLTQWCEDTGTLFVLDDVVTGFRYGPGGAAGYYQLKDRVDLYCFGKAMGNGAPIACLAGRKAIMDWLREKPGGGGRVHWSGTFSGEPFGLAAVIATLTRMQEEPPWGYIHAMGNYLKAEWNALPLPWKLVGHPTRPIIDPKADMDGYDCLRRYLFDHGHIAVDHPWFATTAHTNAHVDELVQLAGRWWEQWGRNR